MAIASGVCEGITISSTKLNIELHRSLSSALITKSSASKKILNIFLLGDEEAIRGRRNLNPKKIAKWTKIRHQELLTKAGLDKGNILRVVASNDHGINI